MVTQNETKKIDHRQEICNAISEMLDDPDNIGIYPTSRCYDRLEKYCFRIENETLEKVAKVAEESLHLNLAQSIRSFKKEPKP